MIAITKPPAPRAYVACGTANDILSRVRPGTAQLVIGSPRYLDLVDYSAAAKGDPNHWRTPASREQLPAYLEEHLRTCALLRDACSDHATLCIEVDDYRTADTPGHLLPLTHFWTHLLDLAGFQLQEVITLGSEIALGHRSGAFLQRPRPGYYYPDNVTSQILVCTKGRPQERLRREGNSEDVVELSWARQFMKTLWRRRAPHPPRRWYHGRHPVPQDAEVVRACTLLYSLSGDVVIDPWAGEGTVGAEATRAGRSVVMIEREPQFARRAADAVRQFLRPFEELESPLIIPGSQLLLPLGDHVIAAARRAFARTATVPVTARQRAIASRVSRECGIEVPAEVAALLLRAERAHCAAQNASRFPPRRPRSAARAAESRHSGLNQQHSSAGRVAAETR